MSAPNPITSRVINFVACGSGPDTDTGCVNYDIINPNNGETAAGVWNKPGVQIPINAGCKNVYFNRPYGSPLPYRIIRYNGASPVPSNFHFDARTMSAGLGFTFFEGWANTVARLNDNYGQRVLMYLGRMFPIFNTTLTPWLWPHDINDPAFQNCPGKTNMATLAYIRHQIEDFIDNGCAEIFTDASGLDQAPTAGRYDTGYKIADALTVAGTFTDADFIGSLANAYARVFGLEAMPSRATTAWAAGKVGMSWLANSNGVDDAFDLNIGNPAFLQPDEMDVWPIVQFQAKDATAYAQAMAVLAAYPNLRVCVKFLGMRDSTSDAAMAEMLALGAVPEDDDGDDDVDDGEEEAPIVVTDTACCSDRWLIIPEVRFAECNPAPVFQRGRAPFLVVELFNETLGTTWSLEDFQVDLLYGQLTRNPRKAAIVPNAPTPGPAFDDDVSPPLVPFPPPPPYFMEVTDNFIPDDPGEVKYISVSTNTDDGGGGFSPVPGLPLVTFVTVMDFNINDQYLGTDDMPAEFDSPSSFGGRSYGNHVFVGTPSAPIYIDDTVEF